MELESDGIIETDDLTTLQRVLLRLLQKSYPSLVSDDLAVDLYTQKQSRRRESDRPVIRISVIKHEHLTTDTHTVANAIVTSFEDGSIHDEIPWHARTHACIHACTHAHTYTRTHARTHGRFPQTVRVIVHAQREVCFCAYLCIGLCACLHTCFCTCTCNSSCSCTCLRTASAPISGPISAHTSAPDSAPNPSLYSVLCTFLTVAVPVVVSKPGPWGVDMLV